MNSGFKKSLACLGLVYAAGITHAHAGPVAKCEPGGAVRYSCESTPKNGDNLVVSKMFDAISVCVKDKNYTLALKGAEEQEQAPVSEIIRLDGGVAYVVKDDGSTLFQLAIGQGNPNKASRAKLTMYLDGKPVSSTYSCARVR